MHSRAIGESLIAAAPKSGAGRRRPEGFVLTTISWGVADRRPFCPIPFHPDATYGALREADKPVIGAKRGPALLRLGLEDHA